MRLGFDHLGQCPTCGAALPTTAVVVAYEPEDGWPTTVAACPDCDDLVHPN